MKEKNVLKDELDNKEIKLSKNGLQEISEDDLQNVTGGVALRTFNDISTVKSGKKGQINPFKFKIN